MMSKKQHFIIFFQRQAILLILMNITITCTVFKKSPSIVSGEENELMTTRKFAGVFVDYRTTVTEDLPKIEVIWIKTSLESRFGKICALGRKCDFAEGDRLYLTRKYYSPGMIGGRWEYFIENDSSVKYQLTEYQSDKKVLTGSWF